MTGQPLLTRELLEGMKRSDLQRVCKVRVDTSSVDSNAHAFEPAQERGLKANLKTEAMIELLLDSPPFVFPSLRLARLTSHQRLQLTFRSPSFASSRRVHPLRRSTILNPVASALDEFYDCTLRYRGR
jgi:hypothetical protein